MVKIACQTIVFSNSPMKGDLQKLAETVKNIGYDGIETGAYLFKDKIEFFADLFAKLDLKLTALHTGADFLNKDKVEEYLAGIKESISVGAKMGCPYLYLSGWWGLERSAADFATEASYLKEIGKMCNDAGLKFCYHNHDWEFRNSGEGLKILLENVPADLMSLVPDMGWVQIAGVSPVQFLKDNIGRLEALHFKDFKGPGQFTELGRGIVPFKDIYDYITGFDRDWWISAEQDRTELDPVEAAKINYEYIAGLGK